MLLIIFISNKGLNWVAEESGFCTFSNLFILTSPFKSSRLAGHPATDHCDLRTDTTTSWAWELRLATLPLITVISGQTQPPAGLGNSGWPPCRWSLWSQDRHGHQLGSRTQAGHPATDHCDLRTDTATSWARELRLATLPLITVISGQTQPPAGLENSGWPPCRWSLWSQDRHNHQLGSRTQAGHPAADHCDLRTDTTTSWAWELRLATLPLITVISGQTQPPAGLGNSGWPPYRWSLWSQDRHNHQLGSRTQAGHPATDHCDLRTDTTTSWARELRLATLPLITVISGQTQPPAGLGNSAWPSCRWSLWSQDRHGHQLGLGTQAGHPATDHCDLRTDTATSWARELRLATLPLITVISGQTQPPAGLENSGWPPCRWSLWSQDRHGHQRGSRTQATGLNLGLRPANERWHYSWTKSLIGWAQA